MLSVNNHIGFGAHRPSGVSLGGNSISWVLGSDGGGNTGFTIRIVLNAALFSADGTAVRATWRAHSGSGLTLDRSYIGEQTGSGDVYDAVALTQLTYDDGNASTGAVAAGAAKASDIVAFTLDQTKNYVVTAHVSAGDFQFRAAASSNVDQYYKVAADEPDVLNVTSFTQDASNRPYALEQLEW